MEEIPENQVLRALCERSGINNMKSFFERERLIEYIEDNAMSKARKRADYKEKMKLIQEIMKKYPKLRAFIEDEEIEELSKEEVEKLLEISTIQSEISNIENEEIFKLGIKNGIEL